MYHAYTDTITDVAGGTLTATGAITSSSTFYGTSKHSGAYVAVFARTYANVLGDNGDPIPLEVANGEVEGGGYCKIDQTHKNFSATVGTYYIAKMDFKHKVYSVNTSSGTTTLVYTHPRTISN